MSTIPHATHKPQGHTWFVGGAVFLLVLSVVSVSVGTSEVSLVDIVLGKANLDQTLVFYVSRLPRTLAVVLSGAAMAIAGLVMQLLVQNRYVEPSTTGVTESAGLGVLVATLLIPAAPLAAKMVFSVTFALAGTLLLLTLVRAIPRRDIIVVPLLGIVLSGVIGALATMLAWQFQLQGTLHAWLTGDFSGILRGRYELLWIVAIAAIVTYLLANRLTVVGLGEDIAKNLGVNHRRMTLIGLVIIAITAGVVTVVSGALPFLGLVVPNLVSLIMGDHLRRSLPIVALAGATFVLISDIIGRSLIPPGEVPVGVVMGIIGSLIFLTMLARTAKR